MISPFRCINAAKRVYGFIFCREPKIIFEKLSERNQEKEQRRDNKR